jgi:glycosyltransferase involved in cell wall biosynthesis
VKFLGTLKQEDHIRAYQGADVFAIASTAETQSLSLMKAMAVEIPVIGARARALPEYIHEDNGFLVDPGDVAGFAEKIVWLFRHPEQRKRFGIEGRKLAERFLPEQIALRWVDFYEQVCSQGALRRVTTPAVFRRWYRRFILRDFVREGIEKK